MPSYKSIHRDFGPWTLARVAVLQGYFLTLILSPLYIENLVLILFEFLVILFSFPENLIEFFIVIA